MHAENEEDVPPPSLEEIKDCVKQLKKDKGTGPDDIPIEQFKCSEDACEELWHTISAVWEEVETPEEMVLSDMMMIYKKKSKECRTN